MAQHRGAHALEFQARRVNGTEKTLAFDRLLLMKTPGEFWRSSSQSAFQSRPPTNQEVSVDPQPRGPDWMQITPKLGSMKKHRRLVTGATPLTFGAGVRLLYNLTRRAMAAHVWPPPALSLWLRHFVHTAWFVIQFKIFTCGTLHQDNVASPPDWPRSRPARPRSRHARNE
jgi:hypothetical protein